MNALVSVLVILFFLPFLVVLITAKIRTVTDLHNKQYKIIRYYNIISQKWEFVTLRQL